MPEFDCKNLRFPDWMDPQAVLRFCQLLHTEPPYDYPADYGKCFAATGEPTVHDYRYEWQLDTKRYLYNPSTYSLGNGLFTQASKFTDQRNVLAVKRVETIGNGDAEGHAWGNLLGEAKFGYLILYLRPGRCEPWSPPIPAAIPPGDFGQLLGEFDGLQQRTSKTPRGQMGVAEDLEAMELKGDVVGMSLPGPYPSHAPSALKGHWPVPPEQCEFGQQWQAVTYDPPRPILDLDDQRRPEIFQGAANFCGTVYESDRGKDTVIIQFAITIADVVAHGALTVAYNVGDAKAVLVGDEAEATPSLFKITFAHLPQVQDAGTWGTIPWKDKNER
ncbi:MAG: hypothetical protein HYV03_04935 [Deltaproteobacteria bacterium]|nr:hypothetical protein [Deltaproteobacteria bacterium]